MRYYVNEISYGKAEGRTTPKGFDTKDEAISEYHGIMRQAMLDKDRKGCQVLVWTSYGQVLINELYGTLEPEPETTQE